MQDLNLSYYSGMIPCKIRHMEIIKGDWSLLLKSLDIEHNSFDWFSKQSQARYGQVIYKMKWPMVTNSSWSLPDELALNMSTWDWLIICCIFSDASNIFVWTYLYDGVKYCMGSWLQCWWSQSRKIIFYLEKVLGRRSWEVEVLELTLFDLVWSDRRKDLAKVKRT